MYGGAVRRASPWVVGRPNERVGSGVVGRPNERVGSGVVGPCPTNGLDPVLWGRAQRTGWIRCCGAVPNERVGFGVVGPCLPLEGGPTKGRSTLHFLFFAVLALSGAMGRFWLSCHFISQDFHRDLERRNACIYHRSAVKMCIGTLSVRPSHFVFLLCIERK
jgi:hypothetical protein